MPDANGNYQSDECLPDDLDLWKLDFSDRKSYELMKLHPSGSRKILGMKKRVGGSIVVWPVGSEADLDRIKELTRNVDEPPQLRFPGCLCLASGDGDIRVCRTIPPDNPHRRRDQLGQYQPGQPARMGSRVPSVSLRPRARSRHRAPRQSWRESAPAPHGNARRHADRRRHASQRERVAGPRDGRPRVA